CRPQTDSLCSYHDAGVRIGDSNAAQFPCVVAGLRNPTRAAVGCFEDRAVPANCRPCVRVGKEDRTQDFGRPANLAQPVGPAIGRSENLSVLSNRSTGQCIGERLAVKYVYGTMLLIFPVVSSVG